MKSLLTPKNKAIVLVALVVVAIALFGFINMGVFAQPLPMTAAEKTCTFVTMNGTTQAQCTDGSTYVVELLASPLP